ncbi:hypothetical protein [Clostridium weizhouense]|uniref:Uncharacterized protein n=1 Tax=Clostridium weizhouense TaxID=2859781 RepID=A0ABS7ASB5_9CLOT|nr:hypothetical protein [Clostridium weizhouense]MBW6410968.1 hypothetical protein [Clostridium weizhouense]
MAKKTNTIQNNVIDILDNKKLWYFVKWYLDGAKENEWDNVSKNIGVKCTYDEGIKNYLDREDIQKALIEVTKLQKDFNLVQIYNKMLEKALEGDVNSANWIVKFSESDFFGDKLNELEQLMEGVSLSE